TEADEVLDHTPFETDDLAGGGVQCQFLAPGVGDGDGSGRCGRGFRLGAAGGRGGRPFLHTSTGGEEEAEGGEQRQKVTGSHSGSLSRQEWFRRPRGRTVSDPVIGSGATATGMP